MHLKDLVLRGSIFFIAPHVQLMGPPQVSLGHEVSSFGPGRHDDKTYSPWVSIAETCPTPEQENVAEAQKPVASCNPIHSGLAEGLGSAEIENLG